jgi:hypothetical protein
MNFFFVRLKRREGIGGRGRGVSVLLETFMKNTKNAVIIDEFFYIRVKLV